MRFKEGDRVCFRRWKLVTYAYVIKDYYPCYKVISKYNKSNRWIANIVDKEDILPYFDYLTGVL